MKELIIRVKIVDEKMATLVERKGFKDDISSINEIIGIIENIKLKEMERLNTNKEKDGSSDIVRKV